MKLMSIYMFFFLALACNEETNPITTSEDPFDLNLEVLVYDNGSGVVVVSASAENATNYHFDMDEEGSQTIVQSTGTYEHTYKTSGTYLLSVRAYGVSGRYVKKEKRITVIAGGVVEIDQGYTTPLAYDGMTLVWNDEFKGNALNQNDWSYEIGNGCPNLCGWGNNELEYYRSNNAWVMNDVLVIEAREENYEGSKYTSARIISRDKQSFQYGRIDIRARLPKGQGVWPALWMLGQNQQSVGWPACGEIDIMEMIGGNNRERTSHGNVFWDDNGVRDMLGGYTLPSGRFYEEFHVFTLIWDEQELNWYVDDNLFHTVDISTADKTEFHQPFFFIMNVAVGGNWPGSPDATTAFPTQMQVDYIRIFQPE